MIKIIMIVLIVVIVTIVQGNSMVQGSSSDWKVVSTDMLRMLIKRESIGFAIEFRVE